MPYYKRKSWKPRAKIQVKTLAKRVARIESQVDKKAFDYSTAGAIDYSGSVNYLSGLTTGSNFVDRIGDIIKPTYLDYKVVWYAHASAVDSTCRTIIFQDTSNQGTSPTPAEVLNTITSPLAVISPFVFQYKSRFKVLFDKKISLSSNRVGHITARIPASKMNHIHYSGSTTGIKGSLYCLNICDKVVNTPTISMYSRLSFDG